MSSDVQEAGEGIAIVGMAGRFPGASNVEEFWRNLSQGVEARSTLTEEDLTAAGVPRALRENPRYVRAGFVLEDAELFDASFFGFSPREAELLDPQQRVFLECAWEALEHAGYDSERYRGAISVFASTSASSYLLHLLASRPDLLESVGAYPLMLANDKDYLATRVAHKLNLKGASLSVQTACSSSLVAIHLACQSLLNGESDMALAGGVSISFPQRAGYLFEEGMILSPDGHCRAFDESSKGTVRGSGAGIVVLRRLTEALKEGDHIYAVIRGSALNNDGAGKVGFTAPSVDGQAAVISEALAVAGVEADSIQYVEAHGTGTALGDPIEVSALTQAFRDNKVPSSCALGSLKTSIGHLDAAAGVAGLLKTTLALEHRQIPPSLHFVRPNPQIDFARSPFFVNAALREWNVQGRPRRAGVSAFGIGGTNAHVVLEEAPAAERAESSRPLHVLVLSAQSAPALEQASTRLASYLERHPDAKLADVAYTLQVGRRRLSHRRAVVCQSVQEAREALAGKGERRWLSQVQEAQERPVTFMFPGQGSQRVDMGRGLYETEPVFRKHVDDCCERLKPHLGFHLRDVLYPEAARRADAERRMVETAIAQPALFVIEYALARWWMSLGVRPQAMIGHSLGEYVAACLAGVLGLDDALALIAVRGQLMQSLPGGAMLSVALPEAEVRPLLGPSLSLAAINAPSLCVVSGPEDAIAALEADLGRRRVEHRRLHTSHAFHSAMMDPILETFAAKVRAVRLSPPRLPYVSNLTGTWITAEAATDPRAWVEHLRRSVRFGDGVGVLLQEPERIFLEVGPGQALGTLARQSMAPGAAFPVLASLPGPRDTQPEPAFLLGSAAKLWLAGGAIELSKLYAGERRQRLALPTYPFQRQRYWLDGGGRAPREGASRHTQEPAGPTISTRSWRQSPLTLTPGEVKPGARWMIFGDLAGLGSRLVEHLEAREAEVVHVTADKGFARLGERRYRLDPQQAEHYGALLGELKEAGWSPQHVVHLWDEAQQALGFYSLLFLAQALHANPTGAEVILSVVTNGAREVTGEEPLHPDRAMVLGPCQVIPQEMPGLHCRSIDLSLPAASKAQEERLLRQLVAELTAEVNEPAVALRGGYRWVETYEPARLPDTRNGPGPLRPRGVYAILGGLGRVGMAVAEHLASKAQARLVLIRRSPFPARAEWDAWLRTHGEGDATSRLIGRLQAFERAGAEILVLRADVADVTQLQKALEQARLHFGELHGVIHAAGSGESAVRVLVGDAAPAACEEVLRPRVQGVTSLARALQGQQLDFVVLQASLASVLGGIGMAAFSAANQFMEAFTAEQRRTDPTPWLSVAWDAWHFEGGPAAMEASAGLAILERLLTLGSTAHWVVSQGELSTRLAASEGKAAAAPPAHPRPALATEYVAPRDEIEQGVAEIWQALLGIDRVGIHDDFFELGGHSLMGTQVLAQVRERFQVELPLRALFDAQTVAGLALAIVQQRAQEVDLATVEALVAKLEQES